MCTLSVTCSKSHEACRLTQVYITEALVVQTQLFVHYLLVFFDAECHISLQCGVNAHDRASEEIVKKTVNTRHFS